MLHTAREPAAILVAVLIYFKTLSVHKLPNCIRAGPRSLIRRMQGLCNEVEALGVSTKLPNSVASTEAL